MQKLTQFKKTNIGNLIFLYGEDESGNIGETDLHPTYSIDEDR